MVTNWRLGNVAPTMKYWFLKLFIQNSSMGTRWEITRSWTPLNLTDNKPILVQLMAWCQAGSNCLSQCWHRSMAPHDVIWVKWYMDNQTLIKDWPPPPLHGNPLNLTLKMPQIIGEAQQLTDLSLVLMRHSIYMYGWQFGGANFVDMALDDCIHD